MENLGKQAGYLKGLLEGMDADATPNGKLLSGIVELLGALSERVEAMDELMEDLNDYVQSIDDDLTELENDYDGFDEDELDIADDDDELPFDDEPDEDFPQYNLRLLRPAAPAPEDEPLLARLCPECKGLFFTAAADDEDAEYVCPHCGARVRPASLGPGSAPLVRPAKD